MKHTDANNTKNQIIKPWSFKMELSPYSLKLDKSNDYYQNVEYLTDEILGELEKVKTQLLPSLILYNCEINSKPKNYQEYLFEFLMIGTFWRVYSKMAVNLDKKHQKILKNLAIMRKENESDREAIDALRGVLMTQFLLPIDKLSKDDPEFNLENFDNLLKYLEASGDFEQEIMRLNFWKEFFTTMKVGEISTHLRIACEFASYFEVRSNEVLGKYSLNVDKFLEEKVGEHLWKEDVIFCSKRKVEYHLNMVGAEIMNRIFKKDFNERSRKALLLPGCMRSNTNCKATDTNLGLKCMKCSKMCNVYELDILGDKEGFEVYIVTHESSAFSKSTQKDRDELGIVGVVCVSNLISGGWKSESLGMPAQCVILNKATCQNHWCDEGVPTSIDMCELMKIFGIHENPNCSIPMTLKEVS
jgi:uncharacterized protein